MSTSADIEESIDASVKRLVPLVGLDRWDITVVFDTEPAGASCSANPEYYEATLTFDVEVIEEDDIDAYVLHELMHCHTWMLSDLLGQIPPPLASIVEKLDERLCSDLARMPIFNSNRVS